MKIGTPENPEIIEPGQDTVRSLRPSRWRAVALLLRWMLSISLPALFFDGVCYWLFDLIRQGSLFAWILLVLAAPAAALLTLVAAVGVTIMSFLLVAAIFGRPVQIQSFRFGRQSGEFLGRFPFN